MAKFEHIHRNAMPSDGRLRIGECWNVALREPIKLSEINKPIDAANSVGYFVTFKAMPGGKLEPLTSRDREMIADWQKRHRNTPDSHFMGFVRDT